MHCSAALSEKGIALYANTWDSPVQTAEAVAERCASMAGQGFRAMKIYPLRRETLAQAETCVRLSREAVGPDVDMMLDFAVQVDPHHSLRAAKLFEPFDPYWIEDPVSGENVDALLELRNRTNSRITTGERQSSVRHCREVLTKRAADVLNPDIAGAGGILAMLEIGAMADAHGVQVSPHNWNTTTVAFMAMLHLCAVMPNAGHAELFYDYLDLGKQFADCDYSVNKSFASLPQRPGLGVEVDEDALNKLVL